MSNTFLCNDSHLDRKVIVKSLKIGVDNGKIIDELTALSAIRSKHVVQILDVIHNAGHPMCLVEEFIEGDDLSPLLPSATSNEALRILYSIAAGISDIHENGRVHRDIKPENMKFDKYGTLKIFDFGLAKSTAGPGTQNLFFTPFYTAPEVFKPDETGVFQFSPAVDVYAFGVAAFWLLNLGGLPPKLASVPPQLPCGVHCSELAVKLHPTVSDLVDLTISADPSKRPTAAYIKDEIGKLLLYDKHRMLLTHGSNVYQMDAGNRSVNLTVGGDSVSVVYDGFTFKATATTGAAFRNNRAIKIGEAWSGASVITLGQGPQRTFITADTSHPEVVL